MTRQHVATQIRLRVMREAKRAQRFAFIDAAHLPVGGRIARVCIVIATYQGHLDVRMFKPPCRKTGKSFVRARITRMQKIAEENNMFSLRNPHTFIKPRQRVSRGSRWQRNTGRAKCRHFAKVCVGDKQRRLARPEQRFLRQ